MEVTAARHVLRCRKGAESILRPFCRIFSCVLGIDKCKRMWYDCFMMRIENRFKRQAISVYGIGPVHNMLQKVKHTILTKGIDAARQEHGAFAALDDNIALSISEEIYDSLADGMLMQEVIDKYGELMCLAYDIDRVWPRGREGVSSVELLRYLEATS